ncbi:MAG: L-serine ammonia-lyase [Rhodobacteraceae bacterium]|nr:L-serine ammonia-lyase [Paracoccaceae bacterium]
MFVSVFDIFKIGVGPSSSHTIGPMIAGGRFLDSLRASGQAAHAVTASLHGSLAFTGKGHATDRAVVLGLAGVHPERYDAAEAERLLTSVRKTSEIKVAGLAPFHFDPDSSLVFNYENRLPGHSNGLRIRATDAEGKTTLQETYYSTGGGTVLTEDELASPSTLAWAEVPHDFISVRQLLDMAASQDCSIADLMLANEMALRPRHEIDAGLDRIWTCMDASIGRGVSTGGILPGGLNVRRRASAIFTKLNDEKRANFVYPHAYSDWLSVYAMAVNEENAVGGQIVTAPTNGAAGVVPATLKYFLEHILDARRDKIPEFLLTAAAIGGLIKLNASISGAECGCQAEVGSASAMAAAGLCAVLGGTPKQVENAAEIALEHHLGMTCDPVRGLVQVPCIERNGLGAIKAVAAASLGLRGDGDHVISLDACIETLWQTGLDMSDHYKETSLGGLAVNVPNC